VLHDIAAAGGSGPAAHQPSPTPQISNEKDAPCLSGDQFAAEYELPGKFGIAGLVIYGGSNDGANPKRCVRRDALCSRSVCAG
jgi:hypothetical protein